MKKIQPKHIIITVIYILITVLLLFNWNLSNSNYSLHGYYSDKIIAWVWLGFTVFIIFSFWKKSFIRFYFYLLIFGLILSFVPMGLGFALLLHHFTTIGDYQKFQLDDNYRIELAREFVLDRPRILIYKREGILEKRIMRTPYNKVLEKINRLTHYKYEPKKNPELKIQKATIEVITPDSLGVRYQINNREDIFFHKINDDY